MFNIFFYRAFFPDKFPCHYRSLLTLKNWIMFRCLNGSLSGHNVFVSNPKVSNFYKQNTDFYRRNLLLTGAWPQTRVVLI